MKKIVFPEYTSSEINIALLADKVNEIINYLNSAHNDQEKPSVIKELPLEVITVKNTKKVKRKYTKKKL
jgi:hypothetical protein